jgi:effector-binding domain-containing protein
MRILKIIMIVILSIVLLLTLISFFLPDKTHAERSIIINRSADVPFALVNDLKSWRKWSPWYDIDSNATWTFSEPSEGTGAYYSWKSEHPKVGNGKITIDESKPFEYIKMSLLFEGMGASGADFYFETIDDTSCKVTWMLDVTHGWNLPSRWFGIFMDRMIGPDYEKGLAALSSVCDEMPRKETIAGFDAELKEVPALNVLSMRFSLRPDKVSNDVFSKSFAALYEVMINKNLEPDGMPMAVYYELGKTKLDFEAAIPFKGSFADTDKIKAHGLEAERALVITYRGAYDKMTPVYEAAYEYIKNNGMVMSGPIREVYLTDPEQQPDTANWMTEIVFPVE